MLYRFRPVLTYFAACSTTMSYSKRHVVPMGSIIARTRKDGTTAYTAQIVIKKGGLIVHREAETFDRKQAANAWVVKREAELKSPGGLDRKENPTLAAVIDRYICLLYTSD